MAYIMWYPNYAHKKEDEIITPFLRLPLTNPGVLRRTREALYLSTRSMAIRMKVRQSTYAQYETSEVKGTLTLAKLAEAAEAMNCELIYNLRPKNQKHFSWQVWEQMAAEVNSQRVFGPTPVHRALQTARTARNIMVDQDFRRRHEWSQRWSYPEDIDNPAPPDYLKNL